MAALIELFAYFVTGVLAFVLGVGIGFCAAWRGIMKISWSCGLFLRRQFRVQGEAVVCKASSCGGTSLTRELVLRGVISLGGAQGRCRPGLQSVNQEQPQRDCHGSQQWEPSMSMTYIQTAQTTALPDEDGEDGQWGEDGDL